MHGRDILLGYIVNVLDDTCRRGREVGKGELVSDRGDIVIIIIIIVIIIVNNNNIIILIIDTTRSRQVNCTNITLQYLLDYWRARRS